MKRAGLFSFGTTRQAETFFSRRIGITNDILGSARLTGQTGPLSIGVLNIQTKKEGGVPGDNFAVARADVLSSGGFFHGDRTSLNGAVGFRFSKHLKAEGQVHYNRISLPVDNGDFDATTMGVNLQAATSRKLFASALIQYHNFSKDLQANIRIGWIHTPGSDLFLVFNIIYAFDDHVTLREEALNDRLGVA